MLGGDKEAADRGRPVFETFSALVVHLGPPGAAQFAKLVNNVLFAANLKSSEDTLHLADALGFDLHGLSEVLRASSGANFGLEALTRQIPPQLVDQYQGLLRKDLDHLGAAVAARGVPAPALAAYARQGIEGIGPAVSLLTGEA